MNISIIIPVYNEAERLDACLKSIAKQHIAPFEVIVVDNNSSDSSRQIAQKYSFVTLQSEKKQGVVFARNNGFNRATGDIIGRIDADTILPETWVAQVTDIFTQHAEIDAISGSAHYYDFSLYSVADPIDRAIRKTISFLLSDTNYLWGANMALRKSAWIKAQKSLCSSEHMHEDFDLAIHLQEIGLKVRYIPELIAHISSRRIDTNFIAYVRYSLISPKTYAAHNIRKRFCMYPVMIFCWLMYPLARILYRSYDYKKGSYSFNKLFLSTTPRVDPTTHSV